MTPEEIITLVNSGTSLTRAHIASVLEYYNDKDSAYVNVQTFLDGISSLSQDDKIKILNDLESYG